MKILITLILSTCFLNLGFAQSPIGGPNANGSLNKISTAKISGTVIDSITKQPVQYATVALIVASTRKIIDGTICDEKGQFSILKVAPGNYLLSVSFIGYRTFDISLPEIKENNTDINAGTIVISPEAKQLKEVIVLGKRELIEEKVDRTVYNAEQDVTTKGGDATDVLKRVPMLTVDMDGNVSLRGSQNVKVLINGKPSTITAGSIADALKQIPADLIKTVEVITSPSAKYDAEGSGGIINIILKKNNLAGFSVNVDGSAGYRGSNLGVNGSYRKGKLGLSLGGFGRGQYNVNGTYDNNQQTFDTLGRMSSRTTQNADTRSHGLFGRYTLGMDYDFNKTNSISASVQYGVRNNISYQDKLHSMNFRDTVNMEKLISNQYQNVKTTDLSGTVDLNATYTHMFAKPQREFSLLGLYSRNNRNNDFVRSTLDPNDFNTKSNLKNLNKSYNQEITIQADYQTPISTNQMLETGAKNIMRKVSSDYSYYKTDSTTQNYVFINFPPSNVFNYNQNITSGYLSYTYTTPSKYSFKVGSRYEYTTITAHFKDNQSVTIPAYGVLVPSANISKKLKNGNMIKIAYNRRIQRPSLQFLNPNIQFSNQFNGTQGNPGLNPEYTNNYELAYSTFIKNTTLNFSAFARNTTGSIQSIRKPYKINDTTTGILTTYDNIGNENAYGFSIFANVNIGNKFTLSGGGDAYYAILKNNVSNQFYNSSNQGWVASARIFGNYNITEKWGLQFFTFYRGRQVQLQGFQGGFGIYSLSVVRNFANKKGSIGFGAENFVTNGLTIKNELNSALVKSNSTNVMHNMNFKINFSFRIGKMNLDGGSKRKKSISNDDMKDGGGDNGGQAQPQGGGGQQQGGGKPQTQPQGGKPIGDKKP